MPAKVLLNDEVAMVPTFTGPYKLFTRKNNE
jgi:hypothetical protein